MDTEQNQTASVGNQQEGSLPQEMMDEINKVNGGGFNNPDDGNNQTQKVEEENKATPIEKITEHERNLFRERNASAKRERELKQRIEELEGKNNIEGDDERGLALKQFTALMNGEDLEEEGEDVEIDENAPLTRAELKKLLEHERKKQNEEYSKYEVEEQEKRAVGNFKNELSGKLKEYSKEMPLLGTIGDDGEQTEEIYNLIEEDYLQNVDEFGEEYAVSHLMDAKEASGLMQNYLAEKFKTMLKSDDIRHLFNTYISELGGSPQQDFNQPNTLTNANTSSSITTGEDDEEARIARAIQAI